MSRKPKQEGASLFAAAGLAGMKYYFVEQDSAPASGDSMRDAGKSYAGLMKLLG